MSELTDRELDAVIAEKVLRHEIRTVSKMDMLQCCTLNHCDARDWLYEGHKYIYLESEGHQPEWRIPNYSTEIFAAMSVIEKLRSQNWYVEISNGSECATKEWFVEFARSDGKHLYTGEGDSDSLPRAICLASLKAIESNEDSV